MRVLVAVASRHGAAREIAEAVGGTLAEAGIAVDVRDADGGPAPEDYDAVVLGSAVYMGRWLGPARDYVDLHADALAARPVWLFSSGPIGDPPKPAPDEAVDVAEIVERTGATEHRLFPGRLERKLLGFTERAVVTAFRAPDGDFRDWDEIAAWARSVAADLPLRTTATSASAIV
jgi:menaquinone-dependent protoporphyrinogen oxidase